MQLIQGIFASSCVMGASQINFWFSINLDSLAFIKYSTRSFICDLLQLLSEYNCL